MVRIPKLPSEKDNPLIYTYLKRYQEDPRSRVFAPLAEAYRKAGLIEEAIEIAREGLIVHPHFIGGRVALARALFDSKNYEQVVEELKQVCQDVPDNLVAQRLLADSLLMLGRVVEALDSYKMLLFFSPNDVEVGQIVRELEAQAYEDGALVLRTDPAVQYSIQSPSAALGALADDPKKKRAIQIQQIEFLQGLLGRIERYRLQL